MALWSLIPAAANLAVTAINKPKKIKYNDKYMQNYIASLRGKKVSGDVRQKALEAENKVIGKQTGRAMRKIDASGADPSQKADAIVNLYTKQNEAIGGASDRASRIQEERNASIDQRMSGAEEYVAKVRDQIRMQNEMNEDQYKSNLIGSGANLLATGVAQYGMDTAAKKATETATSQASAYIKSLGIDPENMTPEDIASMVENKTITPEMGQALITRKPAEVKEIARVLTQDEITERGFNPAPEGYQWAINTTGNVTLQGKTPSGEKEYTQTQDVYLGNGTKQKMKYNPETDTYDIPIGQPFTTPKPTTDKLGDWVEYAKEMGVPDTVLAKAKSYKTVEDLTKKWETLQYKKQDIADINVALEQAKSVEGAANQYTTEYLIGRTKLTASALPGEKINLEREIAKIEEELGLKTDTLESIFGE